MLYCEEKMTYCHIRSITYPSILLVCLFWLVACAPVLPDSIPPTTTETSPGISEQLNRLATQTYVAASTSTVEAQPEHTPDQAVQPVPSPSPQPAIITHLEEIGPFHQLSLAEALIAGKVLGLQAAQDGLLLFSESGYSRFQDDHWTGYFTEEMGALVGVDASGSAWVAARDGTQIARWDEPQWSIFASDQGWAPISISAGIPVKPGLSTDSRGYIWLSTEQDVRTFDGNRWHVYGPEAIDMPLPEDGKYSTYTILPIQNTSDVYVGRCDWGSLGPAGGPGIRRFDGHEWYEVDPALNTGCAAEIIEGSDGQYWIGLDSTLFQYKPGTGDIDLVPLPVPPPKKGFGYFTGLTAGPDGSLWAQLSLCNGDACYGGEALYRLRDSDWQQIGEPSQAFGQKLLFDSAGTPWLFSAGGVYQIIDSTPRPVEGLVVLAATVDDSGEIWLVAQSTGPPTLWTTK